MVVVYCTGRNLSRSMMKICSTKLPVVLFLFSIFLIGCCGNLSLVTDYSDITDFLQVKMTIHMQRRFSYYIVNILYPCLMMSLLVLMVFILPPDSGEKVSLGVTVLLAFSVFQLMIAENVPSSSEATPILGMY